MGLAADGRREAMGEHSEGGEPRRGWTEGVACTLGRSLGLRLRLRARWRPSCSAPRRPASSARDAGADQ